VLRQNWGGFYEGIKHLPGRRPTRANRHGEGEGGPMALLLSTRRVKRTPLGEVRESEMWPSFWCGLPAPVLYGSV